MNSFIRLFVSMILLAVNINWVFENNNWVRIWCRVLVRLLLIWCRLLLIWCRVLVRLLLIWCRLLRFQWWTSVTSSRINLSPAAWDIKGTWYNTGSIRTKVTYEKN